VNVDPVHGPGGFTLIELLAALLVLSLLALMAWRGLGVVMTSRDRIQTEAAKWRQTEAFFTRFEHDLQLASPRPVRSASASLPAWLGRPPATAAPVLEFTRFAGAGNVGVPHRIGYGINGARQIELWIWPGLDRTADTLPVRYVVLNHVRRLDVQYLGPALTWTNVWPATPAESGLPLAVRLKIELDSGETLVRVFALHA
jgi:general secretion pathway protein J